MNDDPMELVWQIAGGNRSAITVCTQLLNARRHDILGKMRKLGIVREKVWLAYKDLGDQTIPTLIANVEAGDLVAKLTALGYAPEPG